MDDDQEEQIKKKKRLVLLLLLALLAVTAGATALIEPTPATTVAALALSPSPPATNAFTATPQVQGDEWLQPTLPSSANTGADAVQTAETTVIASDNNNEVSSPDPTSTAETQQKSEVGLTPTEPGPTPFSVSIGSREATGEPEINPVTPVTFENGTAVAGVSPSTNPDELDASTPVAPIEESETVINSDEATLIPTEISRRINESWDVLDGRYISTAEAEDALLTLAVTATLTKPSTLSETMVVIPPDGLPITGTIFRRRMNWVAVAIVVLLLGTGVTALLFPRPGHK